MSAADKNVDRFGQRGDVEDDDGELVGALDFGDSGVCRGIEVRVARTRARGAQIVVVRAMADGARAKFRVFDASVTKFLSYVEAAAERVAELRGEP